MMYDHLDLYNMQGFGKFTGHEKCMVKGHLKLTVWDARTGELIPEDCQETDNVIVTNGYALLADCIIGDSTVSFNGVGSGSTPVLASDSNLETAIGSRKAITTATRAGAIALFSTFYSSADNNGIWRESVLATELSGDDTIISHALYTNPFTKDNTKNCQNDWTLEFTEV